MRPGSRCCQQSLDCPRSTAPLAPRGLVWPQIGLDSSHYHASHLKSWSRSKQPRPLRQTFRGHRTRKHQGLPYTVGYVRDVGAKSSNPLTYTRGNPCTTHVPDGRPLRLRRIGSRSWLRRYTMPIVCSVTYRSRRCPFDTRRCRNDGLPHLRDLRCSRQQKV